MEITLEAIISFIGLFIGGGAGAFFTWRYQKQKAKAEAESAEIDAAKDLQDMYQQMLADSKADREDRKTQIEELRTERDHYKKDRNDYRDMLAQRDEEFRKFRSQTEEALDMLRRTQARQGRIIEAMRPFMCADLSCKMRQRVATLDAEALERTVRNQQHDIEPNNED